MKLPKDEFKKLQLFWYQKLADLGFKDIEEFKGDELVLKHPANHCFRHFPDSFSREMKEEYFRCLAQIAFDENTVYRNEADKHILIRYAEGTKIKDIFEELVKRGTSRTRDSIRYIIRRYEMSWGIKQYTPKQLHKKTS